MTPSRDTTQYLYGNPGNPFQLTASRSSDNTLTTYSYDTSGNLFAFERGGSRYYVATDQLGSPKVVTDNVGTVVKQVEYDAWGVKLSDRAPAFDLPVGFAGGIPEPVTGLVRFGFRDYEPGTGRWVAKDPVLFEGGQGNLYGYVGNSPVTLIDPSGEYAWVAVGAGVGAVFNLGVTYAIYGEDITLEQASAAIVSGAISGAVGSLAGPLGGAFAKSTGFTSTGVVARLWAFGISAQGGALGQDAYNNIDPCHASSIAKSALYGGLGGGVASYFKIPGMRTLYEAEYFGVRTMSGVMSIKPSDALIRSSFVSSFVSAMSNIDNNW